MNYYADIKDTDIFGIADADLTRMRLSNSYTTEYLDQLTQSRQVKIAIVYTIGLCTARTLDQSGRMAA